ncbi:HipA domain-containing protein [Mesorhizobium atlanticum]
MRKEGRWFKPIGTAATTHILKPQIGRLPNGVDLSNSVENEYLCLKLLEAFGVPAARAEIADFGEAPHADRRAISTGCGLGTAACFACRRKISVKRCQCHPRANISPRAVLAWSRLSSF